MYFCEMYGSVGLYITLKEARLFLIRRYVRVNE
jgi:hypothetical protein